MNVETVEVLKHQDVLMQEHVTMTQELLVTMVHVNLIHAQDVQTRQHVTTMQQQQSKMDLVSLLMLVETAEELQQQDVSM